MAGRSSRIAVQRTRGDSQASPRASSSLTIAAASTDRRPSNVGNEPAPRAPPAQRAANATARAASSGNSQPGARMSLHQDKDELDLAAPIVSVSLGLPAIFLFGGLKRSDKPNRFRLQHGDIAVWGGPARLAFHGVAPLADGEHAVLGRQRINLTFRKTS